LGYSVGFICVNSGAGLAAQLHYAQWDWMLTGKFVVCSLIGMALGIPIARWAPEQTLRKVFDVVVLAVAGAIGWQVLGHH
jgi:uncharacterized membrane protein YfcA